MLWSMKKICNCIIIMYCMYAHKLRIIVPHIMVFSLIINWVSLCVYACVCVIVQYVTFNLTVKTILGKDKVAAHRKWHTLAGLLFPPGCQGDNSDEWYSDDKASIIYTHLFHSPAEMKRQRIIQGCSNQGHTCWIWYYAQRFRAGQKTTLKHWNDNATPAAVCF